MRSPFTKASGVKFMKRLMMLIKKSKEFFLIISRVVRLLWNSSKSNFIKTIIVSVISGITIPFTLVIWKYLIDDMSRSIVSGSIAPVLFWLILYFILNYLQSVLIENKRLSTEHFIKLLKSLYKRFDFEKDKRYRFKVF